MVFGRGILCSDPVGEDIVFSLIPSRSDLRRIPIKIGIKPRKYYILLKFHELHGIG
jgi:hypothetical protein